MHSSRLRTVRCSGHRGRGCLPEGCLPRGVSAQGGVCPGGVCSGVSAQGVSARGVSQHALDMGVCIPACTGQGGVCSSVSPLSPTLVDRILNIRLWKHYLNMKTRPILAYQNVCRVILKLTAVFTRLGLH